MTKRRPRVLVIAEAANPEWVSVPLVGWSITSALRNVADIHLCTQVRNRNAILRAGWREGEEFTSIDTESIAGPLYKIASLLRGGEGKGWTTVQALNRIAYPFFEKAVWAGFQADLRSGRFDIVHRVTPLSPTIPSWIAPRIAGLGVPFILGPLNGGAPWPKGFEAERRREREWLAAVRGLYKRLPGRSTTLESSSAVIVGSRFTQSEIPDRFRDRTFYIPENGINTSLLGQRRITQPIGGPMRCIFVGRLVAYKGPDMLLEAALPLLLSGKMSLDIIGDGPLMPELQKYLDAKGVVYSVAGREEGAALVRFHGWLDHASVQERVAEADLFCFPSIREFGGGAVLEAMAAGVPPLVINYAGPGELVDEGSGFKIDIGTGRSDVIDAFGKKLAYLVSHRDELSSVGETSRDRAMRCFTWAKKAKQIGRLYDWVLGEGEKPNLDDIYMSRRIP